MSEVLQANIFFYIASAATVIFCILLSVILFQLYKLLRTLRRILDTVETTTTTVAHDVGEVRKLIKRGVGVLLGVLGTMLGSRLATPKRPQRKSKSSK